MEPKKQIKDQIYLDLKLLLDSYVAGATLSLELFGVTFLNDKVFYHRRVLECMECVCKGMKDGT